MNEFRSNLPENEGLVILPAVYEWAKRALRNKKSQKHPSLPLYKKRGRKWLDSMYRNRVGRKANALRKVNCLPITHIVLLNYLYLCTNWTTMHTMNFLGSKRSSLLKKQENLHPQMLPLFHNYIFIINQIQIMLNFLVQPFVMSYH